MNKFVHLHVHSHYSVLDGMSKVEDLVRKAYKNGMNAMALTDHGVMYGIKEFVNVCRDGLFKKEIEAQGNIINNKDSTKEQKAQAKAEIKKLQNTFKPILGVEAYCARRSLHDKDKDVKMVDPESGRERILDQSGWHLVLLAKNKIGYKNLCKLVSISFTQGFYSRPRIDKKLLEQYHEGIIVCSACLGGELPQLIMAKKFDEAERTVNWFKSVFADDFYIEIQRHKTSGNSSNTETYERQCEVIPHLLDLAKKTNTKVIATNDVHFVEEEHADAHERLICLATGKTLDDPSRMQYTKQEWLKTPEQMAEIFSDMPEVLANTLEIADKVEIFSIDAPPIMPQFDIPSDFATEDDYRRKFTHDDLRNEFSQDESGNVVLTPEEAEAKVEKMGGYDKLYRIKLEADYLAKLTWDGAKKRFGEHLTDEQINRIKYELHVMKTMGFPGYFLIVEDYVRYARDILHVAVGPGRGSAAGSLVAYCLRITDLDPLKYDLLFERFLNPDRISLPDIDQDFDDDGRADVLRYVIEKYGHERVARIITYGTMATKMAIKDVGRVQGVPLNVVEQFSGKIPKEFPIQPGDEKPPKVNLDNCLKLIPEFKEVVEGNDSPLKSMLLYANQLENTVRSVGVHPCGVIIGADDLTNFAPLAVIKSGDSKEDLNVIQYEGSVVEQVGLIKMDILGLRTLSIIKDTVENIKDTTGQEVDIAKIPLDDAKTYELFCKGQTVGVFQFEEKSVTRYLCDLQPSKFEDLIVINALNRPGPKEYVPQYIRRRHGEEEITYDLDCMEDILRETCGITVYQEQVMLLSRKLANFTRGESDTMRKAMGKKKRETLDQMKSKFIAAGAQNGHPVNKLEKIWTDWEKFADYAFNKSHSTCYAWLSYQTAWLKANYTSHFMAANLTRSSGKSEDVAKFLFECKSLGINMLGPDVNYSIYKFRVMENGDIRFGLGALKGLGEKAIQHIVEIRKQGQFTDIFNFFERVNHQVVTRKQVEVLILAGAFDNISQTTRRALLEPDKKGVVFLDMLMQYGIRWQQEAGNGQLSLFANVKGAALPRPLVPTMDEWSKIELLERERQVVGTYFTAHPLDDYRIELQHVCNTSLADLQENFAKLENKRLVIGGLVVDSKELMSKNNKAYGRFVLEDFSGKYEFTLFGRTFADYRDAVVYGSKLLIDGTVKPRAYGNTDELEFKINAISSLDDARKRIRAICIDIPVDRLNKRMVGDFGQTVQNEKGPILLKVRVIDRSHNIVLNLRSRAHQISMTNRVMDFVNQHDCSLQLLCHEPVFAEKPRAYGSKSNGYSNYHS